MIIDVKAYSTPSAAGGFQAVKNGGRGITLFFVDKKLEPKIVIFSIPALLI